MYGTLFLYTCLTIFLLLLLANTKLSRRRCTGKRLPGPLGLPWIGNALSFSGGAFHEICRLWSYKYGDVFGFRVFKQDYIVVSSYEAIREVLIVRGNAFGGRMPWKERKGQMKPFRDILNGSMSSYWKMMRNSVHGNLKMYGNGLAKFESSLARVVDGLLSDIKEKTDKPFDIYPEIYMTMATFVMTVITGQEIDRDADVLVFMKSNMEHEPRNIGGAVPSSHIGMLAPWLAKLFNTSDRTKNRLRKNVEDIWDNFLQPLKTTPQFRDGNGLFSQLVDLQAKSEGNEDLQFSDGDMRVVISNLLLAGTLTTSSTIYSCLEVLIHKPRIQDKIAAEVHSMVGMDGRVTLAHKKQMPYTLACVLEILRFSNVSPIGIPHMTTEDTEVDGFHVKKGTGVIVNYWQLLHDENFYQNPWDFVPERFIDDEGMLYAADHPLRKRLLAFGAGPRVCLGEVLARNRLFIIIATLMQKFQFSPENDKEGSYDPRRYAYGAIMKPPAFLLKVSERETECSLS